MTHEVLGLVPHEPRPPRRQQRALVLSLEHERRNDQLIVRRTLSKVPARPEGDLLTVVVLLFRPEVGMVTNASATIVPDPLTPDVDVASSVMIPDVSEDRPVTG